MIIITVAFDDFNPSTISKDDFSQWVEDNWLGIIWDDIELIVWINGKPLDISQKDFQDNIWIFDAYYDSKTLSDNKIDFWTWKPMHDYITVPLRKDVIKSIKYI